MSTKAETTQCEKNKKEESTDIKTDDNSDEKLKSVNINKEIKKEECEPEESNNQKMEKSEEDIKKEIKEEIGSNDENNEDIELEDEMMKHLKNDDGDDDNHDVKTNKKLIKKENEKNSNDEFDNENDAEFMKMFRAKIKLSDGTEEYIFSSGVRHSRLLPNNKIFYSKSFFPINCHLCKFCQIKGKFSLSSHINSQEHKKLVEGPSPNAIEYRKPIVQPYDIKFLLSPIKIYPGEIIKRITSEYYERILPIKECEFKPRPPRRVIEALESDPIHDYNKNSPILGLCYAFKMKLNSGSTHYYCTLCRTDLHGEAYQHFVGAGHQADYILRHFKNLHCHISEALEASISNSLKRRKAMRDIFRVLYRKIELLRGLRKICIIDSLKTRLIYACRNSVIQYHYDENTISFSDDEIQELINKAINGEHIIDSDPMSLKERRDKSSRSTGSSKHSSSISRREIRRRSSPPESKIDDSANAWDRYRRMLGATLDDLDDRYKGYEDNPEKHPEYESEWKRFWRRRTKELEKDHIDPERYDFKPEWEKYWAELLDKYYKKEISRCKYDIKMSLRLPLEKRSPSPIRRRKARSSLKETHHKKSRTPTPNYEGDYYQNKRTRLEKSPIRKSTPKASVRESLHSIDRSDERHHRRDRYHHDHERDRDRDHHHSAEQRDRRRNQEYEGQSYQSDYSKNNKRRSRSRSLSPSSSPSVAKRMADHTKTLNVVSILRLLTALEDQLGSLGPKAIDFLGKAILFEKEGNTNSNQLLRDQEYYMFLMTSMEKLRGQVFANIVPHHKIHAVNNVINDIETIIQQFDEYKRQNQVIFGNSGGNNSSLSSSSQMLHTNSYGGNLSSSSNALPGRFGRLNESDAYRNSSTVNVSNQYNTRMNSSMPYGGIDHHGQRYSSTGAIGQHQSSNTYSSGYGRSNQGHSVSSSEVINSGMRGSNCIYGDMGNVEGGMAQLSNPFRGSTRNQVKSGKTLNTITSNNGSGNNSGYWPKGNNSSETVNSSYRDENSSSFPSTSSHGYINPFRTDSSRRMGSNVIDSGISGKGKGIDNPSEKLVCPKPPPFIGHVSRSDY